MKNVLSNDNLISWLETQDPEEKYNYYDAGECMAARYCHDFGIDYRSMLYHWSPKITDGFAARLESVAVRLPHNYGAALDRARSEPCETS